MIMNNVTKKSLKGFLLNSIYDIKSRFIFMIFLLLIISLPMLIEILTIDYFVSGPSVFGEVLLFVAILLCLWKFRFTSSKEISKKFVFPITKKVYAIGNYISIIIEAFLALVVVSALRIIELLLFKFIELLSSNFHVISDMTIGNYLVGFWVSFCYLVFYLSLAYLLAMCFHHYKIEFIAVLSFIILFFIIDRDVGIEIKLFSNIFNIIHAEPNIGVLSFKLLLSSVVFNVIAYFPLKRMEVKK